jgi:large subunit ribosomal protein L17
MAPAVKARRRVVQLLGDKKAARIVFEEIAPRFVDRPGGYTRILKLATPRLGDAGPRAILEFVSQESTSKPQKPRVEAARPVAT